MRLTPEQLSARKKRNLALAGALIVFIVLVFTTTVLKMKGNLDDRKEAATAGQIAGAAS
ncbi:hypothetical protein GCM10009116_05700 [Brevundimonas basaltis]|uniref:Uncharacterized protein involved in response to NO n=1 Tax=Brevundimonas basaltis TaxID=472166 RepID=A0A7W8MHB2_9CAUL|nr:hypothetical protein [Brevundimonas basaltis]MBB5293113.1 uncharacterized protein involved in response to NO [Brevundimonas basaltis]